MSNNTLYANTPATNVGTGGGALSQVNVGGGVFQLTAEATPCRLVYLSGYSGIPEKVFCSFTSTPTLTGMLLDVGTPTVIPIDDVSKLWFSSDDSFTVYATYVY